MSFNDILEAVDKLPQEDQQTLMEIVRRRQIALRRKQIARDIASANREYRAGKCKIRTPEEIMRDVMS